MCGDPKSTLAQQADIVLDVNVEQEACPLNLAPTSSTTVMLALGDALAMVLLEARGFKKEDFAKFHPAGMVGRSLLMRVHQIMRPREALALVLPDAKIRDVLKAMTAVRAGAAVIADWNRPSPRNFHAWRFRATLPSPTPESETVWWRDLMTLNPVTVHQDKLAVEVLNLLERHRIDDLVVVDDETSPVGIVDSQDLTRLKLLVRARPVGMPMSAIARLSVRLQFGGAACYNRRSQLQPNEQLPMAAANDLRKGMAIKYNGNTAIVLDVHHRTPGNLRAFVQAIIRYIGTGKSADVRFGSTDKVELVDMNRKHARVQLQG